MIEPFEQVMRRGGGPAIRQIGAFFEGTDPVHQTLRAVVSELKRTGTPYAVTGAMALVAHGYRRTTTDVDVLLLGGASVDRVDSGRFIPAGNTRSSLRDLITGVRVDLCEPPLKISVDGGNDFAIFHPPHAITEIEGVHYLDLPSLLATKLIHGIHGLAVMKHLADVVETIKYLRLPLDFAASLPEDVRPKFIEYWHAVQVPDPHGQGHPW